MKGKKIKILFVIRNIQMLERIGIMTLSSILKKAGHNTDLVQTELESIDKKMKKYKPDILAYSITTGEVKYMIPLNKKLKEKYKFISIFGGAHPTFFPEVIKEDGVDIVCIGEGEYAFLDLANSLAKGKPHTNIEGLWVKKGNKIFRNPPGRLVKNLDELPFADLEIMYEHDKNLKEHGEKRILLGRGCPFNCTYCFNHKMKEMYGTDWTRIRMKSVDYIIKEVKELKRKYPVEFIRINDDTFGLFSKEWLDEFAIRWKKEIGLPFLCLLRANIATPHLIKKLKEAGCYSVFMGLETGNNEIRNNILKRNITKEDIARAHRLLKKYKIKIAYFNLLGLPVKNALKYDFETLEMNIKYKPTLAWSSILTPYPKTGLTDYAIKNGFFDGNFDNLPANNKLISVLNFDKKEKRQIENLHKLFGITVQFPFLLPLTKLLIKLPQNKFYIWLCWSFFGFKMKFRMVKLKLGLQEILKLARILKVHTRD